MAPGHGRPGWDAHGVGQQAHQARQAKLATREMTWLDPTADPKRVGGGDAIDMPPELPGGPPLTPVCPNHPPLRRLTSIRNGPRLAAATASPTRPWPHERSADGASLSQPASWRAHVQVDGCRRAQVIEVDANVPRRMRRRDGRAPTYWRRPLSSAIGIELERRPSRRHNEYRRHGQQTTNQPK
jgi:hypothetical protein